MTATEIMFYMCGAGGVVAGILQIITRVPENLSFGFGCGIYYGTVFGGHLLSKLFVPAYEIYAYIIAFGVDLLICQLVWFKEYKQKYDEE